jgi:hypothetical protein
MLDGISRPAEHRSRSQIAATGTLRAIAIEVVRDLEGFNFAQASVDPKHIRDLTALSDQSVNTARILSRNRLDCCSWDI